MKIAECSKTQQSVAGVCVCLSDFYWTLAGDDCEANCGDNTAHANGRCTCARGFQMNTEKTVCVKIAGCGENQICVAGKCECLEGFFWTLGADACVARDNCGEH